MIYTSRAAALMLMLQVIEKKIELGQQRRWLSVTHKLYCSISEAPPTFSILLPLLISAGYLIATIFHTEPTNPGTSLRYVGRGNDKVPREMLAVWGEIRPYLPLVSSGHLARAAPHADPAGDTGDEWAECWERGGLRSVGSP